VASAIAHPIIVVNNGTISEGRIITFDFIDSNAKNNPPAVLVDSFVPEGFKPGVVGNDKLVRATVGRGVALVGGFLFYTEIPGVSNPRTGQVTFGPTDFIRVVPFNAGKGAAKDILTVANPRNGTGIQDLATDSKGNLWVLTGYEKRPLQVFEYSVTLPNVPNGKPTLKLIAGPIAITDVNGKPVGGSSDGFTVLPSGDLLINTADALPNPNNGVYVVFDGKTGKQVKGKNVTVPLGKPTLNGARRTNSGADVGPAVVNQQNVEALFFVSDNFIPGFFSFTESTLDGKFITKSLLPTKTFPNGLPMEDIAVVDSLTGGITPSAPEPGSVALLGLSLSLMLLNLRRSATAMTMGMVDVARLATWAATVFVATITSTFRWSRSATDSGNRA
jgi:hypothetical protein